NASSLEIEDHRHINDSDLGLPNLTYECTTCGTKAFRSVEDVYPYILYSKVSHFCEGHYGMIKFNVAIPHPYFLWEMTQILNKICPACKSIQEKLSSKVNYVLLLPNITIFKPLLTAYRMLSYSLEPNGLM
ncbi:hypothetical protein S83_071326, partial [Arachis hypogaea]